METEYAEAMTDRAKHAMHLAEETAKRLQHLYVAPEHIMLGVVQQGDGIGATVLKELAEERIICAEIERRMKPGAPGSSPREWPLTPHAKRAMRYAHEEARRMSHRYIGTEHILLGLLHCESNIVEGVVQSFSSTSEEVCARVFAYLGVPDVGKPIRFTMPGGKYPEVCVSGQIIGFVKIMEKVRLKIDVPPWKEGDEMITVEYVEYVGPAGKGSVALRRRKHGRSGRICVVSIELMFA